MKYLFMQRRNLETIVLDFMKTTGISREEAIKEINSIMKTAEPDAEVMIMEEFSTRNIEYKR